MSAVRALVQKPRRKMHLAVLDGTRPTWLTYCDLRVDATVATAWEYSSAGGATSRLVQELHVLTSPHPEQVCAHCRRFLLLITLLSEDRWPKARQ